MQGSGRERRTPPSGLVVAAEGGRSAVEPAAHEICLPPETCSAGELNNAANPPGRRTVAVEPSSVTRASCGNNTATSTGRRTGTLPSKEGCARGRNSMREPEATERRRTSLEGVSTDDAGAIT